jgi:uncharacterized lipoprotein YehR (DUF1307 family)
MKGLRLVIVGLLVGGFMLSFAGCGGKKADETKPMSEVKAEAEKMSGADLRVMALAYKNAIVAKKAEVDKTAAKVSEIPVTELLGEEAKKLKADLENVKKSVSALSERFQVYHDKLKEKGGDTSGLEL